MTAREQNQGFVPVANFDELFEHNTRCGEYMGLQLAFNMLNLLKADLEDIKRDLDIYFEDDVEQGDS